jgi:L-lysine exporter family protein LysE/ArgO
MLHSWIAAFAAGMGLGGSLIIAIGAQNAFVLRKGLRREQVFTVTTICFLADTLLIALGAGGFAELVSMVPWLSSAAAWGGAAFLLVYGARAFLAALKPGSLKASDTPDQGAGFWQAAIATLAISLLNPHVYLDTVILIGGLAAQYQPDDRLGFAIGAVTASFVWFYGLGFGARRLAPFFARPAAWRLLDGFICIVMWSIAVSLIRSQLSG